MSQAKRAEGGPRRLRRKALAVRFWNLVGPVDTQGCRPWLGSRDPQGYGVIWVGRQALRAHRVALDVAGRTPSSGQVVLHSCDHPWCVAAAHLSAGTRADNNRDMREKGRQARGESSGRAVLTDEMVLEIRERYAAGETALALAQEFGVSDRMVGKVAQGLAWSHVGGPISPRRHRRHFDRAAGTLTPPREAGPRPSHRQEVGR